MAPAAIECSFRNGSEATGDSGQDQLCVASGAGDLAIVILSGADVFGRRSRRTPILTELFLVAVAFSLARHLLFAQARSQHPGDDHREQPDEPRPAGWIDAQSERIDDLLFDSLVRRDEHFQLQPWLAESWETPDSLTYIFHLHHDVRFQNGQPLTARDVKWTFDSLLNGKAPQLEDQHVCSGRSRRRARRLHRRLPPEGTDGVAAVECLRRRHWHRAVRQRRRFQPQSDWLRPVSFRQRPAGQECQ